MRPGVLASNKGCWCVCELQRPEHENENGGHRGTVEPRFFRESCSRLSPCHVLI